MSTVPAREAVAANHARLTEYLRAPDVEDPDDPTQVRAMQMVLRVEKVTPPDRGALLVAAARAVALVCLDERCAPGGPWASAMDAWCGARIRKIARRARGSGWEAAQQVWGVTATAGDDLARAYVPSTIGEVDPRLRKLQIEGTDVDGELPTSPTDDSALALWINPHLSMTVGKTAAQVGHAAMLGVSLLTVDETMRWYAAGCPLSVCAASPQLWDRLLDEERGGTAVAVHDAGFTEIAPGSVSVIAARSSLPLPIGRAQDGVAVDRNSRDAPFPG